MLDELDCEWRGLGFAPDVSLPLAESETVDSAPERSVAKPQVNVLPNVDMRWWACDPDVTSRRRRKRRLTA
jgi:hypothetical protein